jgi:hypothetical protein
MFMVRLTGTGASLISGTDKAWKRISLCSGEPGNPSAGSIGATGSQGENGAPRRRNVERALCDFGGLEQLSDGRED